MKKSVENLTQPMSLFQDTSTNTNIKGFSEDNINDMFRNLPQITRLLIVIIATSVLAFFLVVAIAVACASHKRTQKLLQKRKDSHKNSDPSRNEKNSATQQVYVDIEDKNETRFFPFCCTNGSTSESDQDDHIYSEVDTTSMTNVPETVDCIYDTIDGKVSKISEAESKDTSIKASSVEPEFVKREAIYNHLAVSDGVDCTETVVAAQPSSPDRSVRTEERKWMSCEYDHLDYSPKTPPSQNNCVYTFDNVSHVNVQQRSPDGCSPRFVIKEENLSEITTHDYFVLERQNEPENEQVNNSNAEDIVLAEPPNPKRVSVPLNAAEDEGLTSQICLRHDYFVVEPTSQLTNQNTITRPPLPPRNRSFRTSLHGDRYVSSVHELGNSSKLAEEKNSECGTFDRSSSLDTSFVERKDIQVLHIPTTDVPVTPEVVPIRTTKGPKREYFADEPRTNHVTTFGVSRPIRRSSTSDKFTSVRPVSIGEKQAEILNSILDEDHRRIPQDSENYTVQLRNREVRKTCKSDVRRPLSFSSNEYIRRALRPKPFYEKFKRYDSTSLVHKELLDIVYGFGVGSNKARPSSDIIRETTRPEPLQD